MRIKKCNTAFTLIEMLVVVAVIAVLVTIVISVATRLDTQGKINRTQNTFALLNTALSEFQDYGFTYVTGSQYANLKFPIDCTGFTANELESALRDALGKTVTITASDPNNKDYSSTQALYFLLSRVPQSRQTIEKIDSKLTSSDAAGKIAVQNEGDFPLTHINDAWCKPLQYDYYEDEKNPGSTQMKDSIKTFPVITSAGPDGKFGTSDDIKSR